MGVGMAVRPDGDRCAQRGDRRRGWAVTAKLSAL